MKKDAIWFHKRQPQILAKFSYLGFDGAGNKWHTPSCSYGDSYVRRCQDVGITHSAFCSLLTRIILCKYSEYSSVARIVPKWFVVYCLSNSTVCLSPPQRQNKLSEPICFKFKRSIYYGEFKCFIDWQIKKINLKLSPECVNQNSWQHIWSVLPGQAWIAAAVVLL